MKLNVLKIIPFAFFLAVLLPSCRNTGKGAAVAEIIVNVDIPESNDGFDVNQIADFEKVIPLEAVGDALIGEINKLVMDDSHIVILDKKMRAVWLFGIDGKFIRRIGRLGNGPKEYVSLDDMNFDREKKSVLIWDRIKQVMLEYDLSGELLKETATGFISNIFAKTEDGYWLYYSYLKNPDKNSLILVDEEMAQLRKCFFPMKEAFPVSSDAGFTSWNGKEYFYYPLSNIVYFLDGVDASPYIEFDFGERTLPYSQIRNMTQEEYRMTVDSGPYLGDLKNVKLSDKYCFFQFSSTSKEKYVTDYYGILNFETSEPKIFSSFVNSDLLVDFSSLLCVTADDELVYPVYPAKHNPIYYDGLKSLVSDVSEESNPILVLYKLR